MTKHHQRNAYGTLKAVLVAIIIFMVISISLLWSWNTLAVDLFQLPEARFKHALSLTIPITIAFLLLRSRNSRNSDGCAS